MKNRTQSSLQRSLMIEILLAMLFFALSATVILQVYVAARNQSEEAALLSRVLLTAQNAADEIWLHSEEGVREEEYDGFTLCIRVTDEPQEAGVLRVGEVTALDTEQNVLLTLPCSRYIPGEVSSP